jgi:hypothetical protein
MKILIILTILFECLLLWSAVADSYTKRKFNIFNFLLLSFSFLNVYFLYFLYKII